MKVVFIGAGNLATHLSEVLHNSGFQIAQIYSRTKTSAKELSELLNVPYTTHIADIIKDALIYFISVSDNAIESVSNRINLNGGLVVHTAGSVSIEIFSKKFENYGVFYPLQTFSKGHSVDFLKIPIFVEANTQDNLQILLNVAKKISQNVYIATSQEREQLHLAAIFCCNFVNHLYHLSARVAEQSGFDFNILSSLISETANKAIVSGNPKYVQTGPAVRNDTKLLQRHLDLLSFNPKWHEIYSIFSENIKDTYYE